MVFMFRRRFGAVLPRMLICAACLLSILVATGCGPVATRTPDAPTNTPIQPTATPTKAITDPWIADFADYLEKLAAEDRFSGDVLIAKDDDIRFEKAYGMAERSHNISNEIDTKFNLGSINKMFTAVAILQLVERGMLSLKDRIIDVLPDYPNRAVAEAVTIHHLLTHTAGMGDCFTGDFFTTPKNQLNFYSKEKLKFVRMFFMHMVSWIK
jgi:CubicO group peptidase (beta-lactamase class C family)